MSDFAMPTFMSKPYVDSLAIYTYLFLGRYVANDIGMLCGSLFDTAGGKTIILFMVFFGSARNIRLATLLTVIALGANMIMSQHKQCKPYSAKKFDHGMNAGFWVTTT